MTRTGPRSTAFVRILFVFSFFLMTQMGHQKASGQGRATVLIAADCTVEGSMVDLQSVAEISGPKEAVDRLKRVSLGYAPNIGATRTISRDQVWLGLMAAGFSQSSVQLDMQASMTARRAGQDVSGPTLREKIESMLLKEFAESGLSVAVTKLDTPARILLPIGDLDFRIDTSGIRNMFAPFSVPVTVRSDGRVIRTFPAQVELEAFADILVTARDLPARSPISLEDVRVERRRLTRPLSHYLVQTAKFNGSELARDLRAGSEITTDSIVSVAVIKPGDLVHIEAQAGNAKIMVMGEARAAGRIGDRIAVKNSQTGASIQATVVDKGKVKVSL